MIMVSAIVLAGGFSSRMGMDKGLIQFRGKPMIQRSLEIVSEVADDIIIIANKEGYEQFGYPVQRDILKEKGPIGGIHSGLTHSNTAHNLVLACDLPMLNADFLQYLLDQCSEEDLIVVPRHGDQLEPLCAIYHRDCLLLIEKAATSSDLSLHGFIQCNTVKFIDIDENMPYYSPYLFRNVNTIEDLHALERINGED